MHFFVVVCGCNHTWSQSKRDFEYIHGVLICSSSNSIRYLLFLYVWCLWTLRRFWGFLLCGTVTAWHYQSSKWHYRLVFSVVLLLVFCRHLSCLLASSLVWSIDTGMIYVVLCKFVSPIWCGLKWESSLSVPSWREILVAPIHPLWSPHRSFNLDHQWNAMSISKSSWCVV